MTNRLAANRQILQPDARSPGTLRTSDHRNPMPPSKVTTARHRRKEKPRNPFNDKGLGSVAKPTVRDSGANQRIPSPEGPAVTSQGRQPLVSNRPKEVSPEGATGF